MGYQPTLGGVSINNPGKKIFVLEHVLSPGKSSKPEEEIVDGIEKLFVEIIEECCNEIDIKIPIIRDAELGEILQNWTISPSLVHRES